MDLRQNNNLLSRDKRLEVKRKTGPTHQHTNNGTDWQTRDRTENVVRKGAMWRIILGSMLNWSIKHSDDWTNVRLYGCDGKTLSLPRAAVLSWVMNSAVLAQLTDAAVLSWVVEAAAGSRLPRSVLLRPDICAQRCVSVGRIWTVIGAAMRPLPKIKMVDSRQWSMGVSPSSAGHDVVNNKSSTNLGVQFAGRTAGRILSATRKSRLLLNFFFLHLQEAVIYKLLTRALSKYMYRCSSQSFGQGNMMLIMIRMTP